MRQRLLGLAAVLALAALPMWPQAGIAQDAAASGSAEAAAGSEQPDAAASAETSGSLSAESADVQTSTAGDASVQAESNTAEANVEGSARAENAGSSDRADGSDAAPNRSATRERSLRADTSAAQDAQADAAAQPRAERGGSVRGRASLRADAGRRGQTDFRRGIRFGRGTERGLAINQVERNSFYYDSGLRRGDLIVSLDGRPIRSEAEFMRFVERYPDRRVPLVVLRDGHRETIYVEYPEEVVQTDRVPGERGMGGGAYLGVVFDAQVRDAAVVLRVNPGSPAEEAGLQSGDLILALNGEEVFSYPDAIAMIRSMRPGEELEIIIERARGEEQIVAVLDAQPNVRTATRPADVRVEREAVPSGPSGGAQFDGNRRERARLLDRDGNDNRARDRRLLPRLRR